MVQCGRVQSGVLRCSPVQLLVRPFFCRYEFQEDFGTWQVLAMADDSEWTKLPTEDKCLHKVGSVLKSQLIC